VANAGNGSSMSEKLTSIWIELTIRIGVLGLLFYWSYVLIRPFITIAIWSIVLTVALYPIYEWLVRCLGGRRRLAAVLLTTLNFLIVIGPAAWLILDLIEGIRTVVARFDVSDMALPPPPDMIKGWPIIGEPIFQFWDLASANLREALAKIAPQLKPLGNTLLYSAAEAGTGAIKFFLAIIVSAFLFPAAPLLVDAVVGISRRLASGRGEEFVRLAGATIRAVSRGVIAISALQAFLAAVGLTVAGIPGSSLIASAVLVLGIIQIGPSIVLIPVIVWSWAALETTTALLFTAYMIPVNLLDNIIRPLVMGRGLSTPTLVILIGVIGGTVSYGITGLFLGPIVLAVIWDLAIAWVKERSDAQTSSQGPAAGS
jgi:predicted PurR-regulated permease PerM